MEGKGVRGLGCLSGQGSPRIRRWRVVMSDSGSSGCRGEGSGTSAYSLLGDAYTAYRPLWGIAGEWEQLLTSWVVLHTHTLIPLQIEICYQECR